MPAWRCKSKTTRVASITPCSLGNAASQQSQLTPEELEAVRELGARLRSGLCGNPELIEAEFQALVNLTEQLELTLAAKNAAERASIRAEAPARIAEGYEDAVAEYFRRLSRPQPQ